MQWDLDTPQQSIEQSRVIVLGGECCRGGVKAGDGVVKRHEWTPPAQGGGWLGRRRVEDPPRCPLHLKCRVCGGRILHPGVRGQA